MAIGIAIVLGLAALAYMLFPILRPSISPLALETVPQATDSAGGSEARIAEPNEQEQAARAALQDVEFDYQLGNIAEPDYRALRKHYLHDALVALKSRHEDAEQDQELDEEIEARLRKMKDGNEQTEA
jgi:hypothetical protein